MLRPALLAIALLLASVPAVHGENGVTFHAQAIATSGNVTIQSTQPAIQMRGTPSEVPSLSLSAQELRVAELVLHCTLAVGGQGLPGTCSTTREDLGSFQDAKLRITPRGDQPYLFLAPDGTASINGSAEGQLVSQPGGRMTEAGHMQPEAKDVLSVDVPGGWQTPARTGARVQIGGAFAIALWDWDVVGNSSSGQIQFQTGVELSGQLAGGLASPIQEGWQRQAYLYSANGSLDVQWSNGAPVALWQDVREVQVDGTAIFTGVTRAVGLTLPVGPDGDRLTLTGRFRLDLQSSDAQGADVALSGTWNAMDAAGHPVFEVKAAPVVGFLFAAAVVVLLALAVLPARFAWANWQFQSLRADVDLGWYDSAARRAGRLRRFRRLRADAALLETVSFLSLGNLPEARRSMGAKDRWPGPPAIWHYLAACADAASSLEDGAMDHLRQALAAAPELAVEAAHNPTLSPLLSRCRPGGTTEGYQ